MGTLPYGDMNGGLLQNYLGNSALGQQAQQSYKDAYGYYLNYTVGSTGDTSNIVHFNPYTAQPAVAVKPKSVTEFDWLRKRVDEVCWKAA